jgi:predicted NBD/HSP70 family sugar kinase
VLVELDPDGRFAVAVDMSRHPIEAALLNLRGRIVTTASGKALAPTGREAVQEVHRLVSDLVGAATGPALGIGIGVPGAVAADGKVVASEQLGWSDVALREDFEEVYGLPTYVTGDAEVAAVAEFGRTSAEASSGLLYAKVDDRVAIGVILGGELQRAPLHGGDLTHLSIPGWTRECRCGKTGCLGTELAVIELLGPDYLDLSTDARYRLSSDDAPQLDDAAHALGTVLAPIVAALDIRKVVVGGELVEWPGVPPLVGAGIEARIGWTPEVAATRLGTSAVILGAAGMVLSEELGVVWA